MTIALLVVCLFPGTMIAQDPDTEIIEVYEHARIAGPVTPTYPRNKLNKGEEGWVVVNFMVDVDGRAFEPVVVDSMGSADFEEAALKSLEQTTFTPASLAGIPVTGSSSLRYKFQIDDDVRGARKRFADDYKRFIRYFNKDDREQAERVLSTMEARGPRSLYEEAFLNLARFYHATRYGDSAAQLEHLTKALFYADDKTRETYLPKDTARELWPRLFVLQAKSNLYAEALETFGIMEKAGDEQARDALAPVVEQINILRDNDVPYSIPGRISENGDWGVMLFKDEFYLDKVQSDIDEIKLLCDKKYLFFEFQADMQYRIPEQLGRCYLRVIGDANAKFELVQR